MLLLVNPLQNSLAGPLALLLAVVFGGAGLILLAWTMAQQSVLVSVIPISSSPSFQKVLWQRYGTWALIAPVFAGAALSGPLAMAALCAFLCWQGSREYSVLANLPTLHRVFMVAAGWLTLAGLLILGTPALAWTPALVFFLGAALSLCPVEGETEVGQRFGPMLATLWGYLYLGWLPAHLVALSMGKAPGLVLAVGLGVALSDVGAFCAGKALRGPKLAPRLSPNKTWGGVLGNFGGAALALALLLFALPALAWWQLGLLAATIATGSVWGDLLESLLKRQRGVKDAGALLPGFGGLLDRIDSLLLVVPLVYYLSLAIF